MPMASAPFRWSQALADEGCTEFFVAEVSEGIDLREALPEVDIFVLAGAHPAPPST